MLKELSKKIFKKVFYYLGIGAFTTFLVVGVSTTAQAVDLAADDIWNDADSSRAGTIADPANSGTTVDLKGYALQFLTAGDGKSTGAITDTGSAAVTESSIDVLNVNGGGALTQTLESLIVDGYMVIRNIDDEADMTVTVSSTSVANVIGGVLQLTSSDETADSDITMDVASSLEVTGITTLTANTGSSASDMRLIVDKAATFTAGVVLDDDTGLSYLELEQDNAVTIAGTVQGASDGEGTIQVTGEGKTFSGVIGGGSKKLLEVQVDADDTTFSETVNATTVDVNNTATFTGLVTATTTTIDAATTFTAGVAGGTNVTMGNGIVLTVAGNTITSTNVKFTDATSQLILSGSDVTITGDINATSTTDSGIITLNGTQTTFVGNVGAAAGTNVLIMTVAAGKRAVITETANFIEHIDFGAAAELEITKAVTSGSVFTMDATLMENTDVADVKILMPVNLVGGETLELFKTAADEASMLANIKSGLSDSALIDYSATNSSGTYTVTATAKSAATTANELGVTTNHATAFQQALLSVVSDTNVDGTAEDAFYNALQDENGYGVTEDTALAKQVAPQTDGIAGSTSATSAMTGSVQGILSNRMASLRSGDAYVTGVAAGNGMSTNSGFLQVFGSAGTQKDTTTSKGATKFGYEAETAGLALGFDGITAGGSVIGLSLSRSDTDVTGKGTGKSTNDIESYTASIYADKVTDNGYLEGSLTFGTNDNATSRIVNTAGLDRTYKGSYDSGQVSLKIGGGVPAGDSIIFFGSITGTLIQTDSYTETSTTAADNLKLKIAQDDVESIVGSLGFKAHKVTNNNKGTAMISLAINNEFGDNTINNTNTYQGGGSAFTTSTGVEALSATLGLGLSFASDTTSFNIGFEAEANQNEYLSHYGTLKLVRKF